MAEKKNNSIEIANDNIVTIIADGVLTYYHVNVEPKRIVLTSPSTGNILLLHVWKK